MFVWITAFMLMIGSLYPLQMMFLTDSKSQAYVQECDALSELSIATEVILRERCGNSTRFDQSVIFNDSVWQKSYWQNFSALVTQVNEQRVTAAKQYSLSHPAWTVATDPSNKQSTIFLVFNHMFCMSGKHEDTSEH